MTAEMQIELPLVLPQGGNCGHCVERLKSRVQNYRGIEVASVDRDADRPHLSIHYDPNLVSLDYVRAIAVEEGAHLEWRFRHEILPIAGLDCVDCARTLESGLRRLDGVLWASASYAAGTLAVEYDSERTERKAVVSLIRDLGYEVQTPPARNERIYHVDGLDCADCALHLEEALRRTRGVADVSVDFSLARLRVTTGPGHETGGIVERVASEMGYPLREETAGAAAQVTTTLSLRERVWRHRRDLSTAASGLLIAVAVALSLLSTEVWPAASAYIAAILIGGAFVARSGWAALRAARSLDMNALMTIAAVGAILVGEWAEGAVAIFLFSLGNTLESYTMDRARRAIRGLMDLSPRRATMLRGDRELAVPVEELRPGDRILVRPGERIPMDGVVLAGESAVNQAPVTGESVPVEMVPGSAVYAGSLNGQGVLTLSVTHLSADTTIARIIKMVEEAQTQKAPSQRFVDRFARVYTPAVIAVAAGVASLPPLVGWLSGTGAFGPLFETWLYRALVLLVIACPCALVISTPVSIISAIASAARSGVLIKGGAHLEALGRLGVVAFDKTGTLTAGTPRVVEAQCVDHVQGSDWRECPNCQQMVAAAAAVERRSEHPLATAVLHASRDLGMDRTQPVVESVEAVAGRGVRGVVDGHSLTIGTHTYIHEDDPDLVDGPLCKAIHRAQAAGQTVMVVRDDCCGIQGYMAVADTLRIGVPEMISTLRRAGIRHTAMLTGDNEATARAIASAAGIDTVHAELLPSQKVAAIEALLREHGAVAMVGDGINDAPALARATVGIAMGAAGTDTALETADVALMADDLSKLPFAVELSRRARRIIQQNLALSLGLKAVFLFLALAGIATLWMAVFADVGASLLVTLNGMRLLQKHRSDSAARQPQATREHSEQVRLVGLPDQ